MESLTEREVKFLAFHLACRLEDYEKELKKHKAFHGPALEQFRALEKLVYTKMIPDSYCGPKPEWWNKIDTSQFY